MPAPVEKGNILIIPNPANCSTESVTVEWSQNLSTKKEKYFPLVAKNESKSHQEVVFYISAEWFNEGHLAGVATKTDDGYKMEVTDRLQYGQMNPSGEGRFIVYHDKGRKPFQHRFVQATLAAKASTLITKVGGLLTSVPYGTAVNTVNDKLKAFVGDALHTF